MKRKKIEKQLKKELDKERFTHTLGVMYTAASLAMAHGADMEQALYAGLLHDCAKCIPNEEKLALCQKYEIPVSEAEEESPFLLHAKLGAYFAKNTYGIQDEDILHAIKVHTTAEPGMNTLDKIIYIADYIEPNRDQAPNLALIRKIAFDNLDKTMELILSDTLDYLQKKGGTIDPLTAETYAYFHKQSGITGKEF